MAAGIAVKDFVLYALVGMGAGWTMSDALWSEIPIFVGQFAAGLRLPSYMAMTAQMFSAMTLLILVVRRQSVGDNEERGARWYQRIIWGMVLSQLFVSILLTILWRMTVLSWPVVVFAAMGVSQVVGICNSTVVMPYVSTHCTTALVSAVSTGVQMSSMMSGLLGIAQLPTEGQDPLFSPTIFFSVFVVVISTSIYAWYHVYSNDIGFITEAPVSMKDVLDDEAETETVSSDVGASKAPLWLYFTLIPLDIMAWGVAPSVIPLASGVISGNCDGSDPLAVITLRYAISMSFVALPLAAFSTTIFPTTSRRALMVITSVGIAAFAIEIGMVTDIQSLVSWSLAPALLVASHFVLRFTDTYIMTTCFRIISQQYAAIEDRKRHSETLGLIISFAGLLSTLITFVLVRTDVITCR